MPLPAGCEHFLAYLVGLEEKYVVIGGTAAAILLDSQGLTFRATQDVDLLLLTNSSSELNKRIADYVRLGKFKISERTEQGPRYYRFREPDSSSFPKMIEIFASNAQDIDLHEGQYVIPIQNDETARISAILLDDEYFSIVKAACARASTGASFINALGNICLKARAYRELTERKRSGGIVDEKDIRKHRNDILRIAVTLTGNEHISLGPRARADLLMVVDDLRSMSQLNRPGFPGGSKC